MTEQEMLAKIAELELKLARKAPTARIKVSPKGGVSYYGLGRWPVTLYKSQWIALQEQMPAILKFVEEHDSELSQGKAEEKATAATV
ncbi:MAG: hypothetical protein ACJ72H_28650 [Candidatus Sulfotelmatobacter sp.]